MRIAYEHADSFVTYPRAAGPSAAATHTRSCAAGPYWWQCGRPAWTTTSGVNLRSKGAQASTCPGMCARAPLLVVVTRSCAAGPYWWQCGRPAWTTTCGVNLRSEGAQASTCPADPATPVDDAAIPVGDGATPRRSHPSSSHLSAASGAYPSNTTRLITQSRAPTDPFAARRPMVAARCSLPVARCPSLRVRRCHDPRVGGQRAQPGTPQHIRNVGGATRPGHTERGTDKRNDVRCGPAQAS